MNLDIPLFFWYTISQLLNQATLPSDTAQGGKSVVEQPLTLKQWLWRLVHYAPPKGQVTVPLMYKEMPCGCTRTLVPTDNTARREKVSEEFRLRPVKKTNKYVWEHIGCKNNQTIELKAEVTEAL